MGMTIEDGKRGTSQKAGVDVRGRMLTEAIALSAIEYYNRQGLLFVGGTGEITLTSANVSGLLFVRNLKEEFLVIPAGGVRINKGPSTGAAAVNLMSLVEVLRNASTGTLISTAAAPDGLPRNQNHHSGNKETSEADLDIFKGAEGHTVTDGELGLLSGFSELMTWENCSEIRLGKNESVAFRVTPPAGNTSQIYTASCMFYREKFLSTQD